MAPEHDADWQPPADWKPPVPYVRHLRPVATSAGSPSPPAAEPHVVPRITPLNDTESSPNAGTESSPNAGPSPPTSGSAPRRKRQATTAACGACRKRKSRCNGDRPKCSVCQDRGTACEYDTKAAETHNQALKRKFDELKSERTACEQLFDVLRTKSPAEAKDVLQRIRGGADAGTILRQVGYGDVAMQTVLEPEASFHFEFPYRKEMPAFLLRANNPYLDSHIYEYSLRGDPDRRRLRLTGPDSTWVSTPPAERDHMDPYVKPFHAATIVDPWLDAVTPSKWTTVCADDALMRKLLHGYFLHDYEWFTFFNKDYFLRDMVRGRHRFCSRLLVNALLCLGSYTHRGLKNRAHYWDPQNISYQFHAEAKRLFEYEVEVPRPEGSPDDPSFQRKLERWEHRKLTTIQATMVLALIHSHNGADRLGWRYMARSVEYGLEIGLFDWPRADMAAETKHVWEYTAWCVFVWQSFICYHHYRSPLLPLSPPSTLPDPLSHPQWYGETHVLYPGSALRVTTHFPHLFKAKVDLWTLMNEYSSFAFSRADPHPPSDILWFYKALTALLSSLPPPLSPKHIVFPHQLTLHMQYNAILVSLLKPIGLQGWNVETPPREACLNAAIRLETLVRLYYLRHGFEALNLFMVQMCASLCQMTIDTIAAEEEWYLDVESLRSTVVLAAKGLWDQSRSFYLAKGAFWIMRKEMRGEERELVGRWVVDGEEGKLEQGFQSDWPAFGRGYHEERRSLSEALEGLTVESEGMESDGSEGCCWGISGRAGALGGSGGGAWVGEHEVHFTGASGAASGEHWSKRT